MHEVAARMQELAGYFAEQAEHTEQLGRLPDETVRCLKQVGAIRMLQPKEYGGYEAHPTEWAEMCMDAGHDCGSVGWVVGVVGVHTHHLAVCDPKVQHEVWGEDPDTWMASPYAPQGTAAPADDGYLLSGRWSFSSGTDHCQWVFLGGILVDEKGQPTTNPPQVLHFILPRSDYEIVDDSWNVMGLKGTGSKDVIVRNAYVPKYRTIDTHGTEQERQRDGRPGSEGPLYKMPHSAIFPGAITAGVLGAAEGVLASAIAYQRDRIGRTGARMAEDPLVIMSIAEAAAELDACRRVFLDDLSRMYDTLDRGGSVSEEVRTAARRNQVWAVHRAVEAADHVFKRGGGNAVRNDLPMSRLWRDAHAALHHTLNIPLSFYRDWTSIVFGLAPTDARH